MFLHRHAKRLEVDSALQNLHSVNSPYDNKANGSSLNSNNNEEIQHMSQDVQDQVLRVDDIEEDDDEEVILIRSNVKFTDISGRTQSQNRCNVLVSQSQVNDVIVID